MIGRSSRTLQAEHSREGGEIEEECRAAHRDEVHRASRHHAQRDGSDHLKRCSLGRRGGRCRLRHRVKVSGPLGNLKCVAYSAGAGPAFALSRVTGSWLMGKCTTAAKMPSAIEDHHIRS